MRRRGLCWLAVLAMASLFTFACHRRYPVPGWAGPTLSLPVPDEPQWRPSPAREPKGAATVREYKRVFRTYPFSDPNPIAAPGGRIYPYYRFDGFTSRGVDRSWTVVELENDYLEVTILPEIGGKIWSAVEKSTGRPFIYDNHVVKFRDVAMRGPWTSGGIEPNYGIIGHTPNCATPVDYVTRTNADGSAAVVIGVLDLLTRTPWRLEVRLPAGKAYFTTTSFWYNATPIEQPYYTWMNAAIKAAGNLQLIYPGTHALGHGGEVAPWPIDPATGRDLSYYEQNDFGPSKSYHVVGRRSDFFGAYWHDDDFGMARYSRRDDKLGKKAWIWGLSRQGMIWEHLLTDSDGQYVEVQSGRLFNQSAEASTLTPFKHRGFEPYSSDSWTEYWFPVKETRGFVKANDLGALNVERAGGRLTLRFSPLEAASPMLEVLDGDRPVYATKLALQPMRTWVGTLDVNVAPGRLRVRLGGSRFDYAEGEAGEIARPLQAPDDFDWNSVFGLYLEGKEWMRQRDDGRAQAALESCLQKDPNYLPALADLAMVRYRAMDYDRAWALARRGLSIDTYDPAANYAYALAAEQLGRSADALDGFEVAAQSPEYRAAAWNGIARMRFRAGDLAAAEDYAHRSLDFNRTNLDALQVLAVAARVRGARVAADTALNALLAVDPLSHFARFERHLLAADARTRDAFTSAIRNEMPQESYLELAAWYQGLGRLDEARRLLLLAPATAEVLYWRAFIEHEQGNVEWRDTLGLADAASPRLVFPFRSESAPVFRWAVGQSASWRPKYYLALLLWSRHDVAAARALLDGCGSAPDFAPFYAARARAVESVAPGRALEDLLRAAALDAHEWRFGRLLAERYLEDTAYDRALETAARYAQASPDHYILGMLHARCLLLNGRYADAAGLLSRLDVLPYEGSTEARALYREAQLMLGVEEARAGRFDAALGRVAAAREWPEHLGAGKPYPENTDERLEDFLEAEWLGRAGRAAEGGRVLERLAAASARSGFARVLSAVALRRLGRAGDAERNLDEWARSQRDEAVAAWGRRTVAGEQAPFPRSAAATDEQRVLAAWTAR
jgi:tetratricopeptide (TPR) repeat protein